MIAEPLSNLQSRTSPRSAPCSAAAARPELSRAVKSNGSAFISAPEGKLSASNPLGRIANLECRLRLQL